MSRQAIIANQAVSVTVLKRFLFMRLVEYKEDRFIGGTYQYTMNKAKWVPKWRIIK